MKFEVPIEYLHERLTYDAGTGELRWRRMPAFNSPLNKGWNDRHAGKLAGTRLAHGYLGICLSYDGKERVFKAHRIAFAMAYGRWPDKIDHINRKPSDNRLSNLREATHAENMQNTKGRGFKVYLKKYVARIRVNGHQKHLGCFDTEEKARQAYLNAKAQLHPFYTVGG